MARKKQIWTTEMDRQRILACLSKIALDSHIREQHHIQELEAELARAKVIADNRKTPADVITMRSSIRLLNLETKNYFECTLVYPAEGDPQSRRISVLAPLGTAMLGYRVGDTFEAKLPRGRTPFSVDSMLYQPEAAGDYDL